MPDKLKRRMNQDLAIAVVKARWLAGAVSVAKALYYALAAHGDEHKGFPCAAAMEWRKAAELFLANTLAAGYCWRQWERIMRLPRQMAIPISESGLHAFQTNSDLRAREEMKSVTDPVLTATAA